ncbi:MAG: type II toxin-antitoxin system VapC family toxin [Deltaproteobacteria bacterium]|nr:type II toxin-antitoxin system VapC family toxin [Deltaproteobacteria bacterium]
MRILLDTSYLYDLMEAPGKLTASERRFFESDKSEFFVSAVSIWEMRLKHDARRRSGARKSPFDPNEVITVLKGQDVTLLPMTVAHAARALETPLNHRDPFDEILLVQAQEENLKLLTADRQLADHPLAITLQRP